MFSSSATACSKERPLISAGFAVSVMLNLS
jgi:hypothetical protein